MRLALASPGFAFRARLLRGLVVARPALRGLLQLVELWAEARELSNPAAGTLSPWALANLAIFAAQTLPGHGPPLLPPLSRLCAPSDPAAATTQGGVAASGGGGGGSTGGAVQERDVAPPGGGVALPPQLRPLQHPAYVRQPSSAALQPVLDDILVRHAPAPARVASPPLHPSLLAQAATSLALSGKLQRTPLDHARRISALPAAPPGGPGLLPLFHWFLTLLSALLGFWDLSWNRRVRASTWAGELVAQPFSRPHLAPLECPLDGDNAARSVGVEVGWLAAGGRGVALSTAAVVRAVWARLHGVCNTPRAVCAVAGRRARHGTRRCTGACAVRWPAR